MSRIARAAIAAAPPWLKGPNGQRFLYALTAPADAIVEWAQQGVKARFPQVAPPTALGAIGRDRGIRRGPDVSDAAFVAQLVRWWDDWQTSGATWVLLDQLAAYFSPTPPRMRVVSSNGTSALWRTREPNGARSTYVKTPSNWNWDGQVLRTRTFLLLDMSAGPWTDGALWGDPVWGDGTIWGLGNTTVGEVEGVRQIWSDWGAAHARHESVISYFDASKFDPAGSGADYPDGTWGAEYKLVGGIAVPTRPAWGG